MKLVIAIIGSGALLLVALPGCAASNGGGSRDASRSDDVVDAGTTTEIDAAPREPRCGDLFCDRPTETCVTCPLDCEVCPTCDLAPTCTGALAVPTSTEPLAVCDNTLDGTARTNYACGQDLGVAPNETTCADPQLRIRIREIVIQRGFFDLPRNLFCVLSAEDGAHSELLLTTPREVAGNRNTTTLNLRPGEGTLWGQGGLFRSISNLTITYSCFLSSDTAGAQRVLDAIAERAAEASEHAGEYGFVFGAVSVIGTIIGSSLGAVSDDQILDVQQTIDAGALLEMTNGRTWEIRQRVGNLDLSGASDLRLVIESWGCAEPRAIFE